VAVRIPPKGTRGVRFPRPPGWLARLVSRLMVRGFRRRGGRRTQGGVHALLLETIGARSGEVRHAMLGYIEEGADSWLVIASLAGAARHPAWLYNLARNPEAVIEFGDSRRVPVRAETIEGDDELAVAWRRIGSEAAEYLSYRSKTDRTIPVVRLRRR